MVLGDKGKRKHEEILAGSRVSITILRTAFLVLELAHMARVALLLALHGPLVPVDRQGFEAAEVGPEAVQNVENSPSRVVLDDGHCPDALRPHLSYFKPRLFGHESGRRHDDSRR